jgi:hypothetical protein
MNETPDQPTIEYRETGRHNVVEAVRGGVVIGTIGPFGLSAGQFGSRWMATMPDGTRSGAMISRDAAAAWLAEQADR